MASPGFGLVLLMFPGKASIGSASVSYQADSLPARRDTRTASIKPWSQPPRCPHPDAAARQFPTSSLFPLRYDFRRRWPLRFLLGATLARADNARPTALNANCLARFAMLRPAVNLATLC